MGAVWSCRGGETEDSSESEPFRRAAISTLTAGVPDLPTRGLLA